LVNDLEAAEHIVEFSAISLQNILKIN
jgi:hypothetical protein